MATLFLVLVLVMTRVYERSEEKMIAISSSWSD